MHTCDEEIFGVSDGMVEREFRVHWCRKWGYEERWSQWFCRPRRDIAFLRSRRVWINAWVAHFERLSLITDAMPASLSWHCAEMFKSLLLESGKNPATVNFLLSSCNLPTTTIFQGLVERKRHWETRWDSHSWQLFPVMHCSQSHLIRCEKPSIFAFGVVTRWIIYYFCIHKSKAD